MAGVTAQYECLRGDVRVYTAGGGLKPIKEVAPGETVFSLDEATGELIPTRVKAAAQTGVEPTYRVTVGGRYHRTIHATANHPLLCLVDRRRPGRRRVRYARMWKTVAELQPGDLVAVARDLPSFGVAHELSAPRGLRQRFPTITNADLMWLLGLWFGDGSCAARQTPRDLPGGVGHPARPRTSCGPKCVRVVKEQFGLRAAAGDRWRIVVNSRLMVDWFEHHSLFGNDHIRRVPPMGLRVAVVAAARLPGWSGRRRWLCEPGCPRQLRLGDQREHGLARRRRRDRRGERPAALRAVPVRVEASPRRAPRDRRVPAGYRGGRRADRGAQSASAGAARSARLPPW